ncbi:MAG TPA: hypothetical protein PLH57_11145, partial [Oligoflexia bacterium]|nr:hypothetical protein [Oligoflexia bacterium]
TITLCIGRIAKGQDLYGPPLPPGFVEPKTMSAAAPPAVPKSESIGFWGQIKAALTSTIGRVIPGNGDSESSDYQKLDVSGRTPTSVSKISSPEADRKIVALVNESIEQSNRLTRLLKDPSTLEFETTKPLLTIAAQEPALRIELHKKYSPESSPKESITFASDTFTNNARLLPLSDKAIIPVTAVHIDELKLVRALLAIVGDKNDNAGDQLHRLGTGTKAEIVKLKSLAFLGHLLFEQNIPTLAATSLVRALDPSQNSPEGLKFNSYTLETLSKVARGQLSAKTLIRPNVFEKIIDHSGLSDEARSFASLVLAERAFDSGRFESARKLAQGIAPKSSWSERGRYLAALCIYAAKPENRASQELAGRELTDLFRTVEDPAVFDAVATALGRIHFILGNYKAANQYLEQVTKETNIWLESAVDNGWSLLKSGDKHHAVGNMFTLHTPYFEGAYMPDSYFLQTLGYQELCQFGDAFTSVKKYKLMY